MRMISESLMSFNLPAVMREGLWGWEEKVNGEIFR